MKKDPETPKPVKALKPDPEMDGPYAEKDEVKKAEDKMRKTLNKGSK